MTSLPSSCELEAKRIQVRAGIGRNLHSFQPNLSGHLPPIILVLALKQSLIDLLPSDVNWEAAMLRVSLAVTHRSIAQEVTRPPIPVTANPTRNHFSYRLLIAPFPHAVRCYYFGRRCVLHVNESINAACKALSVQDRPNRLYHHRRLHQSNTRVSQSRAGHV